MRKIFDFVKRHPYVTINSAGTAVILLCFVDKGLLALFGLLCGLFSYGMFGLPTTLSVGLFFGNLAESLGFGTFEAYMIMEYMPAFLSAVILTVLNIIAFRCIKKNKNISGMIFTLLLGTAGLLTVGMTSQSYAYPVIGFFAVGAFMGTLFNREYKYAKAVRIIFNIQLWICVWLLVSYLLYALGYYDLDLGWQ